MRAINFLALVILLIFTTATAGAATIVMTQMQMGPPETVPAPPQPIILQVGEAGSPPAERVGLMIHSVPADDPDRIVNYSPDDGLSRSWVITEDNAADYCVDWDEFEAALSGENPQIDLMLGYPTPSSEAASAVASSTGPMEDFQLERIEIDLDYWLWHPILTSLRAYRLEGRVIGEAAIVPEPATWIPVMGGACAAGLIGQRKRWTFPTW
jgi:hypothetical protein